jgi:SpoVK/Ycf46/Vps4 family AAA+-type ATPase
MADVEGMQKNQGEQIVMTAHVKMVLGHLEAWFQDDHKKPFLLVGPPGCGKK